MRIYSTIHCNPWRLLAELAPLVRPTFTIIHHSILLVILTAVSGVLWRTDGRTSKIDVLWAILRLRSARCLKIMVVLLRNKGGGEWEAGMSIFVLRDWSPETWAWQCQNCDRLSWPSPGFLFTQSDFLS